MHTTYGIFDPITRLCVYIGRTENFERRRREHLASHRQVKVKRGTVQFWLKNLHKDKLEPQFAILEVVETEGESLLSESKWTEKFAQLGHGLFNRWDEHKELIEAAEQGRGEAFEPLLFTPKGPQKLGACAPNANKTGYRITLTRSLKKGQIIDLLPRKDDAS